MKAIFIYFAQGTRGVVSFALGGLHHSRQVPERPRVGGQVGGSQHGRSGHAEAINPVGRETYHIKSLRNAEGAFAAYVESAYTRFVAA